MIPRSLPLPVPSSVTGVVECPVSSLILNTSARVESGVTFVSLGTKPALYDLTFLIISASDSMLCAPYIKETPPSVARATASLSPDTACIIALTIGIFIVIVGFFPFLKRTNGVERLTFSGMQSFPV